MTGVAHQKVNAGHLKRNAYLYVRQSTLRQVFENTESTKRQYGLRQHAVALGWPVERSTCSRAGAGSGDVAREPVKTRNRGGLLTRLERLECRAIAVHERFKFRYGHLKRLPREYQGERHVVVARHLPSQGDQEWVDFEERPGTDPNPTERSEPGTPTCINVVFVEAYPGGEVERRS